MLSAQHIIYIPVSLPAVSLWHEDSLCLCVKVKSGTVLRVVGVFVCLLAFKVSLCAAGRGVYVVDSHLVYQ